MLDAELLFIFSIFLIFMLQEKYVVYASKLDVITNYFINIHLAPFHKITTKKHNEVLHLHTFNITNILFMNNIIEATSLVQALAVLVGLQLFFVLAGAA